MKKMVSVFLMMLLRGQADKEITCSGRWNP